MRRHSPLKVAAYVRLLRKVGAPPALIGDFEDIVRIDEGIAEEGNDLEALDRLLLDVCRRFGFADPPGAARTRLQIYKRSVRSVTWVRGHGRRFKNHNRTILTPTA